MVVHRFMSDAEYEVLIAGGRLMNGTVHGENGSKSTSIGFCFFSEDPEVAVHWLSGICNTTWLVTLDFPPGYLKESVGTYRDAARDDLHSDERVTVERKEWCCTMYDNRVARVLDASREYAHLEQLRQYIQKIRR